MNPKLVEKGDAVHDGDPVIVSRYTVGARINHWVAAGSMIILAFTGLMMYWPLFFPLSEFVGGGQLIRAVHPWIGVVMLFSFAGLFFRFWRLNIWEDSDLKWAMKIKDVLAGNEEELPAIGKYNFGQKCIFWVMSIGLVMLIVSGLMIWNVYFGSFFSIPMQRWALIVHSMVAAGIIAVWIFHMYAVYWIRGSLRAMVRGKVTGGFANVHHRKWYDAMLKTKKTDEAK